MAYPVACSLFTVVLYHQLAPKIIQDTKFTTKLSEVVEEIPGNTLSIQYLEHRQNYHD